MSSPKMNQSQHQHQRKSVNEMWEEYRRFWLDTIAEWRQEGLITDELLERSMKKKARTRNFLKKIS